MWWVDVVSFSNSLYTFFHSVHSAKGKRGHLWEVGQGLVSTSMTWSYAHLMWGEEKIYISNLVRNDKVGFDYGIHFEGLNIITLSKNFAVYFRVRSTRHVYAWCPWGTFSNLIVSEMYLQAVWQHTNSMILQNQKLVPEWQVINNSGQWTYMAEVSRLLVASPRLRPMKTFFFILFSSLIGIDAPYLLLIIIILFFITIC